eukprot:3040825-Amphidinium_carterae.1
MGTSRTAAAATAATTATTTTRPGETPMVTPPNAKKRARASRTPLPVLQDGSMDGLEAGLADVIAEEGSQPAGSEQQEQQQKQQQRKTYGMQWQQLSTEDLMTLMTTVEPVALSFPNLRQGLGTSRSRYIHKTKLLEVLEFISGDKPTDTVTAPTLMELAAALMEYNRLAQRPTQNLALPPKWPQVGVYELTQRDGA